MLLGKAEIEELEGTQLDEAEIQEVELTEMQLVLKSTVVAAPMNPSGDKSSI